MGSSGAASHVPQYRCGLLSPDVLLPMVFVLYLNEGFIISGGKINAFYVEYPLLSGLFSA